MPADVQQPAADGQQLLAALDECVRSVQLAYAHRPTEIASDRDPNVVRLCNLWDLVWAHGLRQSGSASIIHLPSSASLAANMVANSTVALLHNVADRLSDAMLGTTSTTPPVSAEPLVAAAAATGPSSFWSFAEPLLSGHERQRYRDGLKNIATDVGRGRALLRTALNERSLERYLLEWLNSDTLPMAYEAWSVVRAPDSVHRLPAMAQMLAAILFAVPVDNRALNGAVPVDEALAAAGEPILVAPPATRVKNVPIRRRHIVSFDEGSDARSVDEIGVNGSLTSAPTSQALAASPRKLSSMCLKPDGDERTSPKRAADPKPRIVSVPIGRYEAVFGLQPELPSEIIEAPVVRKRELVASVVEQPEKSPEHIEVNVRIEGSSQLFDDDDPLDAYEDEFVADESRLLLSADETQTMNTSVRSSTASEPDTLAVDDRYERANGTERALENERLVEMLRKDNQHLVERCESLENRVAELSLENHRLRGLFDVPGGRQTVQFSFTIPRVYLDRSNGKHPYYLYEIRIVSPTADADANTQVLISPATEWTVLRRYSDFYELHRTHRRQNDAVKALEFPPKKHFGNMDANFVELRRQRLQLYIRNLFDVLPEARACKTRAQLEELMPFFVNTD